MHIFEFTKHGQSQGQRRGIRPSIINIVFEHADQDCYVRGGCYRIWISSRKLDSLVAEGILTAHIAERCRDVCIIEGDGHCVTVYKGYKH